MVAAIQGPFQVLILDGLPVLLTTHDSDVRRFEPDGIMDHEVLAVSNSGKVFSWIVFEKKMLNDNEWLERFVGPMLREKIEILQQKPND